MNEKICKCQKYLNRKTRERKNFFWQFWCCENLINFDLHDE